MSQTNKGKTTAAKKVEEKSVEANKETVQKGKKTLEETDKLIDKIDDVLEENAEEFVKNYVQKGGE